MHDLRVYGYDTLLNKYVTEILRLSLNGFENGFPIIGKSRITLNCAKLFVTIWL